LIHAAIRLDVALKGYAYLLFGVIAAVASALVLHLIEKRTGVVRRSNRTLLVVGVLIMALLVGANFVFFPAAR
jgi:H+/Cl- antiporter ClcA